MNGRPTGVDLFAGAGGLSLGFEQAGFDVVAAVEYDPVHAATHHFNFPQTAILPRSVVGLRAQEIRAVSGTEDREIDVVFGGPPCQGFSLIGQRAFDDPRNRLVEEYLRLVVDLEAKYFVFENVKGLTVGEHQRFLEELVEEFKRSGYNVRLPWRILNARNYNVPQDRERLFILGAKRGLRLPEYPAPLSGDERSLFEEIRPVPTCEEALADLPDVERFDELKDSDSVLLERWKASSTYAKELHCETIKAWHYGYPRKWNPLELTSSMRTDHTDISRRRFAETPEGDVEPISRFFKLSAKGVCNTLRAGTDSARGAFTSPRPIHYKAPRCITVREMARLHGYPDWFRFNRTKWHGARQVGNSVAPPLARCVAKSIMTALGIKPSRPRRTISLGDPHLLEMDMTEAATHFGVPVPIGRRDRKTGARKRKQEEIENERRLAQKEA